VWIQVCLLPGVEESLEDELTQRLRRLVSVLLIVRVEQEPVCNQSQHRGRPRKDRGLIARAFVAKALYNLPHTDLLLEMLHLQPSLRRICGWERKSHIPSAPTFSRAFAQFAQASLGDRVHAALVQEHVGDHLVMHVSRDATEISAREKAVPKPKAAPPSKKKRGRPKKGEVRPPPEPTRLQRQLTQGTNEAIAELPRICDFTTRHFNWEIRACSR
jgi:hypothetical protein